MLAREFPDADALVDLLKRVGLVSTGNAHSFHVGSRPDWKFLVDNDNYFLQTFAPLIDDLDLSEVSGFSELQIRASLQIIRDVLSGSAQYEHIQPLLRRVEAFKKDFSRVIAVGEDDDVAVPVTVISLRECKQDVKKILPILIAKFTFCHSQVFTFESGNSFSLIIENIPFKIKTSPID